MKKSFWFFFPRVLIILFNLFLALFALDVFESPQWPLALLIHLMPNIVLTIVTIIAWKYEVFGGMLILGLGSLAVWFYHSLIVGLPMVVMGLLFILVNKLRLNRK